jgi:hypothetical protein
MLTCVLCVLTWKLFFIYSLNAKQLGIYDFGWGIVKHIFLH